MAMRSYSRRLRAALLVGIVATLAALAVAGGPGPAEAAFPGSNGKIVFQSSRVTPNNPTGDPEIFAVNPDGNGYKQFTFNTTADYKPTYSPNGARIVYSGYDGPDFEIFTIPSGGGQPFNVTNNSTDDTDPAFSPDGARIAYSGSDGSDQEIFTVPVGGGPRFNVTNNSDDDRNPDYSLNGARIVYQGEVQGSDQEIFTVPAGGGARFNVTNNSTNDYDPTYSLNGARIAYAGYDGPDFEIFTIPAGGGQPFNVTNNSTYDSGPAFSPDGTRIAHKGSDGSDDEIFTVPVGGGPRFKVTNNAAEDGRPDWQPNTAPTTSQVQPAPGSTTADRTPTISAVVRDTQTNLAQPNITLYVDGSSRPFSYNPGTDQLSHTSTQLSLGSHTVRIVARDEVGLANTRSWGFRVVSR